MVRSPNTTRRASVVSESLSLQANINITMYGLPLYPRSVESSGPPTPSRIQLPVFSTPLLGQMYRREGPAHQQRTTWFGGGYCTTYGLDDPLPAFNEHDPFAWQVEGIEKHRAAFGVQHHLQVQTQNQMQLEFQAEMRRQQSEAKKKAQMQAQVRSRLLGRGETHGMMSQGEDFMAARCYFERENGYAQDRQHQENEEVIELRAPPSTSEWMLAQPTQIGALGDVHAIVEDVPSAGETRGTGAIASAQNSATAPPFGTLTLAGTPSAKTSSNKAALGNAAGHGIGYTQSTGFKLPGLRERKAYGTSPIQETSDESFSTRPSDEGSSSTRSGDDGSAIGNLDGTRSRDGSPSARSGTSPDRTIPRSDASSIANRLQFYIQRRGPETAMASSNYAAQTTADSKPVADSEPAADATPSTPGIESTVMTAQEFFWEHMRAYTRGEGPRDPREPLLPFTYNGSPEGYQNYTYVPFEPKGVEDEGSEHSSDGQDGGRWR